MPSSMTGFGRSQDEGEGRLSCEIRSVNHRFLVSKIRLPGPLQRFEPWIDAQVRRKLKRGSVEVQVQFVGAESVALPELCESVADHYRQRIGRFLKARKLGEQVSAEFLLGLPGVMLPPDPSALASNLGPRLKRVVSAALEDHVAMRLREGERMTLVLGRETKALGLSVKRLRARAPKILKESSRRLQARLDNLLAGARTRLDSQTLAREVAVLADRSDVTEELDRLAAHAEEFDSALQAKGPVGRSLDFLIQELGREVNTIGSKTQDLQAISQVLKAKGIVERLREQVQNLE